MKKIKKNKAHLSGLKKSQMYMPNPFEPLGGLGATPFLPMIEDTVPQNPEEVKEDL